MKETNVNSHTEPTDIGAEPSNTRPAKLKWTEDETQALVEGCNKHGVGSWTQILSDPELSGRFSDRTPGDLKDRFRTYFPDSYHELYPNAKTHWGNQSRGKAPDGRSIFAKGKVKERRPFTEEEDRALLRGYRMYGSHWALIGRDPAFKNQRRSTDVRDRFRNAFPEEYARAGYKPRSKARSKNAAKNKAAKKDATGPSASVPQTMQPQPMQTPVSLPLNTASAPMHAIATTAPANLINPSMQTTPISSDYGFQYSQALLSPVMLQAAAESVPSFDRSNKLQWFDPVLSTGQTSDKAPFATDMPHHFGAVSASGSLDATQQVRPANVRTRAVTFGGDMPIHTAASAAYQGNSFPFVDRAWNTNDGDYPMGRGRNTDNVTLFPTLPSVSPGEKAPPVSQPSTDPFYLPGASFDGQENADSVLSQAVTSAMTTMPTTAFSSFPALDQQGTIPTTVSTTVPSSVPTSVPGSMNLPMDKSTSDATTSTPTTGTGTFLDMGLPEQVGLQTSAPLLDASIPSSGLESNAMLTSFSEPFSPFLSHSSVDMPSTTASQPMDKTTSLPVTSGPQWGASVVPDRSKQPHYNSAPLP